MGGYLGEPGACVAILVNQVHGRLSYGIDGAGWLSWLIKGMCGCLHELKRSKAILVKQRDGWLSLLTRGMGSYVDGREMGSYLCYFIDVWLSW